MRTRSGGGFAALGLLCCAQPAAAPAATAKPAPSAVLSVTATPVAALPLATPAAASRPGGRALQLGASVLQVELEGDRFDLDAALLFDWILRCARAVEAYYGSFPVAEAKLVVHATRGRGVHGGHTQPGAPPRIDIQVGVHVTARELERNWSLTHELVHLAFPSLARSHLWLEEGLASYVEPIARARAGWLTEADVWREWLDNLERGLPEPGDRGLDHTPTWGRTYWGGALFCFLADLRLRQVSGGRHELRDALRAIVSAGGNINEDWNIERALQVGDAATQTDVLTQLYQELKDTPVHVDLEATWLELGVSEQGGEIRYDDSAPLAALRKLFVLGH